MTTVVGAAAAIVTIGGAITYGGQAVTWWNQLHEHKVVSTLERSPALGVQFWQDGQQAPMSIQSEQGSSDVVSVALKRTPFELWLPTLPPNTGVQVCAWTDNSIFSIQSDGNVSDSAFFAPGTGIADYEYGSGALRLTNQAHNYFIDARLQAASSGMQKVYVSTIASQGQMNPVSAQSGNLYLAVYIDKNSDSKFDVGDFEYFVLSFG